MAMTALRRLMGDRPSRGRQRRDRQIEADGQLLPVQVVEHARARRLTLRVMPGGRALKVTVPPHVDEHQIDEFLSRNRNWVAARLSRLPESVPLGEGARIPYLGVDHRIVHLDRLRGVVEVREIAGEPCLLVPGEPDHVPRKVADFLKKQARTRLDEAVTLWRNGVLVFAVCDTCAQRHDILMSPVEAGIEVRARARGPLVIGGPA